MFQDLSLFKSLHSKITKICFFISTQKKNSTKSSFLTFLLIILLIPSLSLAASAKRIYKKNLKTWTRSATIYTWENYRAEIKWNVTYLSPEMLQAQSHYYASKYELNDNERKKKLKEFHQNNKGDLVFFVSFYAPDRRFADLSQDKGNWELQLEVDGQKLKPKTINKLNKYPTPLMQLFYPYIDTWSQTYRIHFDHEKVKAKETMELSIFNPKAKSSLKWD